MGVVELHYIGVAKPGVANDPEGGRVKGVLGSGTIEQRAGRAVGPIPCAIADEGSNR